MSEFHGQHRVEIYGRWVDQETEFMFKDPESWLRIRFNENYQTLKKRGVLTAQELFDWAFVNIAGGTIIRGTRRRAA